MTTRDGSGPQAGVTENQIRRALRRARDGASVNVEEATALLAARGPALTDLMASAARTRDAGLAGAGRPGVVTYSPKVFVPVTRLCRDRCHYCTFAVAPARLRSEGLSPFLTADEVLDLCRRGAALGVKEALFTLGDRPEDRWPEAREWLAEITRRLAAGMGLGPRMLPMTEDEVTSYVLTVSGSLLHFQEFHVGRRSRDEVRNLTYRGIDTARPAPGVLAAVTAADLVVIAPSNPLASVAPILALPGVTDALRATAAPVVAVTPVVTGVPITDPGEQHRADTRAGLLRSVGLSHSATSAAVLLREVADAFVLDVADEIERDAIAGLGLDVLVADTLGPGIATAARAVLDYRRVSEPSEERQ
jgi:2-phospho-L-lactate transferase